MKKLFFITLMIGLLSAPVGLNAQSEQGLIKDSPSAQGPASKNSFMPQAGDLLRILQPQTLIPAPDRLPTSSPSSPPVSSPSPQLPSTIAPEKGFVNPRSGELSPGTFGGAIDTKTGGFLPKVGGGYINPKTGEFLPAK